MEKKQTESEKTRIQLFLLVGRGAGDGWLQTNNKQTLENKEGFKAVALLLNKHR